MSWDGPGSGDTDGGVFAQKYDANGVASGGEFRINSFTTGLQHRPRIAMNNGADYVVTWSSTGSAGNDNRETSVQGRAFNFDDGGIGAQFQVNAYTTQTENKPDVALLPGRALAVTWQESARFEPNTFVDVRMRRSAATFPIFADGFESGNTSACSLDVP